MVLHDEHQLTLLSFDGPDYRNAFDAERLTGQIRRVFDLMQDGEWRTLGSVAELTGDPAPSVSAQLRHLRKRGFGSHTVNKRNRGGGLFEYQLVPNEETWRP